MNAPIFGRFRGFATLGALAATLLALGALTLACASVPDAPAPARVTSDIAARTGVSVAAPPATPAPGAWSSPPGIVIDDGVTMDEAVAAALWNNPDFQVALASLELSRADLIEAGLIRNPILSLLFPVGPKQLEWTLSWPIDVFWQRPRRIETARISAEVVAEQLVAHGVQLAANVRVAWTEAQTADGRLAFAAEQADLAGELARLAEGRLAAGDISDFDSRLVQTDAARLQVARLSQQGLRDRAQLQLRTLMGLDPGSPALTLTPDAAVPMAPCGDRDTLIETALAARPEVRAAELAIEAAGARAGLEKARVMTLTATLDANAKGSEGFEMGPGLSIELPVFSRNDGARARAAAELEQASRRYLAVRAAIAAGVSDALIHASEALASRRVLTDTIGSSLETERRQAQHLYEAGEISLLTLLETRRRLIDADAARLDADAAARLGLIRLDEAVGRTCNAR